jgi:hypothetical protein
MNIRIIMLTLLLTVMGLASFACGSSGNIQSGGGSGSPTDAYKQLYTAVKSKNTDAIKLQLSKTTLAFADMASQRQNTPVEMVVANGFTSTTFSEKLPEIRDERVDGPNGAIEVWNSKESRWEDLPFVKEETGWKLAVGDLFKGTWKSPGKGQSLREMEAANAINGGVQRLAESNSNAATNSKVTRKLVPGPAAGDQK